MVLRGVPRGLVDLLNLLKTMEGETDVFRDLQSNFPLEDARFKILEAIVKYLDMIIPSIRERAFLVDADHTQLLRYARRSFISAINKTQIRWKTLNIALNKNMQDADA
jgi:hypothetical protein